MAKYSLMREFWDFMLHRKLLWMTPIIGILVLLSVFIFITEGSAVLPFIYAVF